MKKLIAMLTALLLMFSCAAAEEVATATDTAEADYVIALVNGEQLMNSTYTQVKNDYLTAYAQVGYDITDEAKKAYVEDLALTAAIQNLLVEQDMRAQGCYDFSEEIETWCSEQGQAAYESALKQVEETLNETLELGEDDADALSVYASAYAELLGVTAQDYVDVYRTQYATMLYYAWLTQDCPVTAEDVQAEYDARKAQDDTLGDLTDDLYDEIAYDIYAERCQEKLKARIDVLSDEAEVTLY